MKKILFILGLFSLFCGSPACKKFLTKNPDESLVVPDKVADFRALLDNQSLTTNSTPGLGALAVDDYVMDTVAWLASGSAGNGIYSWQPTVYQGYTNLSWANPYQVIYTTNVVLDGMTSLTVADSSGGTDYNAVYGTALFYRAFQFFNLEETFGQPYRPATAATDAGIPLRFDANALAPTTRANVATVFHRIDADLLQAISLLPAEVQRNYRNRPCRPAAWALLARSALVQQDYTAARRYADSCLALNTVLADYDTVRTAGRPFYPGGGNDEVLFQCSAVNYSAQYAVTTRIDSTLYASYSSDDLRRLVFFQKTPSGNGVYFKGQYTGLLYLFTGMATDEVYLIRAESAARLGDLSAALGDLNTLLSHRWKAGTFQPYTAATADAALFLVLQERRKELLFRDLRWSDLRRLNQDIRFAGTLKRVLGSKDFTLPPNDPRYTFLIPETEIRLSGIAQNPVQ